MKLFNLFFPLVVILIQGACVRAWDCKKSTTDKQTGYCSAVSEIPVSPATEIKYIMHPAAIFNGQRTCPSSSILGCCLSVSGFKPSAQVPVTLAIYHTNCNDA
ncbi:hypothetical protein MJO28_010469 [Puccinia striiformis f. sp. tritici]|uniref:Uncharacterized protein n=1 Tax=Puccinia striiformis f. sp. tritici TaxID=168172 RepID=A0ACC0E4K3_9BASI|nr:hypothetical protein Pst134EB_020180 [Puccinia striiformis f. sp. tritici]KAI7944774.1 hypothetical protein MJO28_010469 [Puccinia striiformis f. sp. tritici]